MGSGKGQTYISYAISHDLETWTRWDTGPIHCAVGRDPFVFDLNGRTILLYTSHTPGAVGACSSHDMVVWEPLADILTIPGCLAVESCSLHEIDGRYVLWFNDYGDDLAGFRAAYIVSDDPMHFDLRNIREFEFNVNTLKVEPSPELGAVKPIPLSLELVARHGYHWLISYFRWHIDRNRLFFGELDWTKEPAVITEINDSAQLERCLAGCAFTL
jgi:hypothetical protein